jgi:hypothetical protein
MSTQPKQGDAVEILAEWEGQAVHHPGVLFEDREAEYLGAVEDIAAIAGWIAVTALSGMVGNSAYDGVRRKVVGFLKGWRARFGQAKVDEVKKQLVVEMQRYRKNSKITDQELSARIELLFHEIDE